jgi:hypothetical protein
MRCEKLAVTAISFIMLCGFLLVQPASGAYALPTPHWYQYHHAHHNSQHPSNNHHIKRHHSSHKAHKH